MSSKYRDGHAAGMASWRNLHVGYVPCHRDKKRHAQWRWGQKKGARRARRRADKLIANDEAV